MDTIGSIIQNAIDGGKENSRLLTEALDESQIFRGKDDVVSYSLSKINSLLQNHTTKANAFSLILKLLPQSGSSSLDDRGLLWLNAALKVCTQQSPASAVPLAFDVIRNLARGSLNAPDFAKCMTHSVMQKVFEAAQKCSQSDQDAALNCMMECMLLYPGPCGPSKSIVEKFALQFIDSTDSQLVSKAGSCLMLMQATRSGGEHGQMHRKYYSEYQQQLIFATHKQLDQILAHFQESFEEDRPEPESVLKLQELEDSSEPVNRIAKVVQRFSNLLKFLNATLESPYPVARSIKLEQILGLIKRGLAVNPKMVSKNAIVDNLIVGVLLPQIHVDLLATLNVLLVTCKGSMRIFYAEVLELLETSLKWTSIGASEGCKKPYTRLRIATYDSIRLYLETLGRGSCIEDISETLILNIINDSTPFKSEIKLQVQMEANKHMSKRAKKKLQKAQNEATNLAQSHSTQPSNVKLHFSDAGNVDLCTAALDTLTSLLGSANFLLKPNQSRTIQQHVVQQCLTLDLYSETRDLLYFPVSTRKALYRALFSLTANPHHLTPPPTQYVLDLLTNAACNDEDLDIREMTQTLVTCLGKSLRPQRQSLFFDVDEDELSNAVADLRKDKSVESEDEEDELEPEPKRQKIDQSIDEGEVITIEDNNDEKLENGVSELPQDESMVVSDEHESEAELVSDSDVEEILEGPAIVQNGVSKPAEETARIPEKIEVKKQETLKESEIESKVQELVDDFVAD